MAIRKDFCQDYDIERVREERARYAANRAYWKEHRFQSNAKIKEVVIPEGIISIPQRAFAGCINLRSVTLPESMTAIYQGAFQGCEKLEEINLPNSITSIGENERFVSPADEYAMDYHAYGYFFDTWLIGHGGAGTFKGCASLKSIRIPDGVKRILPETFYDCTKLESVHIPDGVQSIEYGTFKNCTSLKEIVLPEGLESIGVSAFENCWSLTKIHIPSAVTLISDRAFADCTSLASIHIPEGVNAATKSAFEKTRWLINHPEGCIIVGIVLIKYKGSESSVNIPDHVESIGKGAFQGCKNLETVVIPDSVTYIGDGAFDDCYGLSSVTIYDMTLKADTLDRIRKIGISISKALSVIAGGDVTGYNNDVVRALFSLYPEDETMLEFIHLHRDRIMGKQKKKRR